MLAMVVTAFLLLADGQSRGALTLDECIGCVLKEDPRIREARIDLEKCRREAALALSGLLPAINVQMGNDFSWGRSVDMQELLIINNRMNCTASLAANASLSSSDICGALLRRKEGECSASAAEESLKLTVSEVIAEVTLAYIEALYSQQACNVCRIACERIESRTDAVRLQVENGVKPMIDLEEMEVQSAAERSALAEAEGRSRKASWTLKRLMNLPPEVELELLPPTEDSIVEPAELRQLMAVTGGNHGIVRSKALLERSKSRLKRARLACLPSISLSGGVGTYYGNTGSAGFGEQVRSNINPYLGIGLTIPVLDGAARARELNEARSELAGLEVEVERQRRLHATAVGNDIVEAESIYGCLEAASDNVKAAEKSYSAAQARFDAGEISGIEFVAVCNSLKSARLGLLQQRCRYLLQLKAMEYRYGIKICE